MKWRKLLLLSLNGQESKHWVECYSRGGTKSPETCLYFINGKRLTDYAFRKAGWFWTVNALFVTTYDEYTIKNLVYDSNPFFSLIQQDDIYTNYSEHNITFGEKDES